MGLTMKQAQQLTTAELIIVLASKPYYLDKKYDLELLTREELLQLLKEKTH